MVNPYQELSGHNENQVFLEEFDITLNRVSHAFFINSLELIRSMAKLTDLRFSVQSADAIRITIDGLVFDLQTEEEIWILNEIFIEGAYNLITPYPIVIWDIGMYIGISSLYFASKDNVVSVEAYELFKDTFDRATENFSLNPHFAQKIKSHNIGIDRNSRNLVLDYCHKWKGSIGINKLPNQENDIKFMKREVALVSATETIKTIMHTYPDIPVVAKIDCEGSEYDIIESLCNNGEICNLKGIMLEWHVSPRKKLLSKWLSDAGFSVFFFNSRKKEDAIGMLYALQVN